ncbi:MAG: autotransporter domain-containing protein [Elusimicrobia bacterium]|nr:autotransporter domain-containing protein [Elusimicrobiota bacterium]
MFKLKSFFYALTLICLAYGYAFATDHYEINGSSTVVGQVYSNFNQSGYGGVFAVSSSGTLTILTTNETKFENNSATGTGGAISNEEGKITIGDNVSFILNTSGSAGGAIYSDSIDFAPEIEIGSNVIFSSNTSNLDGGAIDNYGSLKIGANAIFSYNKVIGNSGNYYGGAISNNRNAFNHEIKGNIEIGANVIFEGNVSNAYGGAISNGSDSTLTIKDGALFKNNSARSGGAIYTKGTVNLIANTNDILFDGNTDDNGSCAICADDDGIGAGKINLFASKDAKITFNDKIRSVFETSTLNINKSGTISDASGTIILNEDMSGFSGDVNIYAGTIIIGENGKWFSGSTTIDNLTMNIANSVIEEMAFKNLQINGKMNISVDADLENEEMDTISTDGYYVDGNKRIKVNAINIISDTENKSVELEFVKTQEIRQEVETIKTASSDLYKYNIKYDESTGNITFTKTSIGNPLAHAADILGLVGGSFSKMATINQAFVGMDTKVKNIKQARSNKILYVSTTNQVFASDSEIQRGVWVRPYATNETMKLAGLEKDIDTTIYGTIAGIDLPIAEDKMVAVYFGYNGSNQKLDSIKVNNTGYCIGATGMLIKDSFYIGATINAELAKATTDTDFGSDDTDMTSYAAAVKAGYNFEVGNNWIIEPNLMVAYVGINTKEFTNAQGNKVSAEDINNVHIEPGVKASLELDNGWTPYGLIGACFNTGEAATEVNGKSVKALTMDPYYECGIGVEKEFSSTPWSCYGEVDGRAGSRQGVGINLGIKYAF